ncbi:MAG: DNA-3-methyladenine glycosylase I, partial [Vallitaleaceae bacterium]|nr:DNA-3-methyladenine glycosylase I [Vallitaleaceae bacterium]
MNRCPWAGTDPDYTTYHDNEWGVPVYDDRVLFEFLVLESAQAGLSWITVLKRREAYKKAYDNFDPNIVAFYDDARIDWMIESTGIIKHRKK